MPSEAETSNHSDKKSQTERRKKSLKTKQKPSVSSNKANDITCVNRSPESALRSQVSIICNTCCICYICRVIFTAVSATNASSHQDVINPQACRELHAIYMVIDVKG